MAEHPNADLIRKGYAAFGEGNFEALNELFAEDIAWHEGGRGQLAGDYRGRDAVYEMFGRLMEISEGTLRLDLHAILADDEHGVALVVSHASRDGQHAAVNQAHVFHLRDGRVTEFWNASTDQYALDELFA